MTKLLQNGQHHILAETFCAFTKPMCYTLHRAVVNYRHFKTTWLSHLWGTGLKLGPLICPEASITNCQPTWRINPEYWRYHLHYSKNLQLKCTVFTKCLHLGLSLRWLYPVYICTLKNKRYSCPCVCHDGVWGNGGVTPLTHNHGARWKRMVQFTFCSLYHLWKIPW